jgi:DNA-binding NarL/FixJ family response regulator
VSKRLLIVDDDPRFRTLIRQVLDGESGFEVVGEAQHGAAALDAVRQLEPDVVLLDVNLPDTNGFDLAPQLVGESGGPAIVMTSSRDEETYEQLAAQAGASAFVSKYDLSPAAISAALA